MNALSKRCALPPPIQTTDLVTDPAWLEACEKYGYNPLEFLQYERLSTRTSRQDLEELQADTEWQNELIRQEYEAEADRLAAILAYDPARFAKVLKPATDECKEWCCVQFAA